MHICLNWLSLHRQSFFIRLYPDNELGRTDEPSLIPPWLPTIMADLNQFLFSISISPRVSSLTKDWKGARTNLSSVFIINSFSFDKPFLIKLLQAGRQIHEMQFLNPCIWTHSAIFKVEVRIRVDPDVDMILRLQIIQIHVDLIIICFYQLCDPMMTF